MVRDDPLAAALQHENTALLLAATLQLTVNKDNEESKVSCLPCHQKKTVVRTRVRKGTSRHGVAMMNKGKDPSLVHRKVAILGNRSYVAAAIGGQDPALPMLTHALASPLLTFDSLQRGKIVLGQLVRDGNIFGYLLSDD